MQGRVCTHQHIQHSTDQQQRLPRQSLTSIPTPTMKFSLALALVSLSVLTAAKHEFVRKSHPNPGTPADVEDPAKPPPPPTPSYVPKMSPKHEFVPRSNPNPGQQGGNGNTPGSSGTPANVGNPAKSQPAATPSSYVPKKSSTSGTSSSGWVQNPTGDASFSARSGCQSPGKS